MPYKRLNKAREHNTYFYNLTPSNNKNLVLLFSKSHSLKELCRNVLGKYNNVDILILKDYRGVLKDKKAKVILLDDQIEARTVLLKDIICIRKQYDIPIIVITENCNHEIINEYHKKGVNFIISKPIDISTFESTIIKILFRIKENREIIKEYHGIILNITYEFATYKECKIFLSPLETLILDNLMNNLSHISVETIQKKIFIEMDKEVTFIHIRTTISRLRKKFKECTGINIIRNRHSRGYSISV
jgi:DNA-binding response OmpR family regulator